jgi:hypothetical protein
MQLRQDHSAVPFAADQRPFGTDRRRHIRLPDRRPDKPSAVVACRIFNDEGGRQVRDDDRLAVFDVSQAEHPTLLDTLRTPAVRDVLAKSGSEPLGNTPEEFTENLKRELPKWNKIVKDAGIKVE